MTAPLPLGRVVATPGALKLFMEARVHPFDLLARHATGDWGELCVDRSYVDGSSCVVLIIDTTHSLTVSRAVCLPSHHSWRGQAISEKDVLVSQRTKYAGVHRAKGVGTCYIPTGKGNTVGVRSCVSSIVMGLAPSSERQGGELHELT